MIVEYTNKKSRFYRLLFYRSFGLILFSIVLICIIIAIYLYKPEESYIGIIGNGTILGLIWTLEYFGYLKYFFIYKRFNNDIRLMIDLDNLTIQTQSLKNRKSSSKRIIKKVTLHSHIRNELPFENPTGISEKTENFLHRNFFNNKKYSNIWYLEIFTIDSKTYFMTPLMLKINEMPFEEFEIVYEDKLSLVLNK